MQSKSMSADSKKLNQELIIQNRYILTSVLSVWRFEERRRHESNTKRSPPKGRYDTAEDS